MPGGRSQSIVVHPAEEKVKRGFPAAQVRLFLTPPEYPEDEEKTRQARLLHALLAGSILLLVAGIFVAVPLWFAEKRINTFLLGAALAVVCLAYGIMRGGRVRLAGVLFTYGLWAVLTLVVFLAGGLLSVVTTFYIVLAVIAGMLLGIRGALQYSAVCCAAGLGLMLLEAGGVPSPTIFPIPPLVAWMDLTVVLIMTTLTMHFAVRDLNDALTSTRQRLEERREAESALRASEAQFRRLFETSRDFVFIADKNGRILATNKAAESRLGYSAQELANASLEALCYDPRDWVQARQNLLERGYLEDYEIRGRRKNGTPIDSLVSAALITDETGRITGFQGNIKDMTARKQTEMKIARQMERLQALHTIEQVITSHPGLQTVLNLLVREIVGQLHVDATSILLLDEGGQTLNYAAGEGFRTKALQFTKLKIGDGLAGRAAQSRKLLHIPNLSEIQDNPILVDSIAGEGFTAYFGVPLIDNEQLCGVMEIFQRSPTAMDSDWPEFLETLAGHAAIAIDNARMLEMTQAILMETEELYRINRGLVASIDPLRLMQEVVDLLQCDFGYRYVQIYVRDAATGDFILRAGSGETGAQLIAAGHRLAAGEGIVGYTAETNKPFLTNNVDDLIFFRRNPLLPDILSELAVPIRIDGQFLGLLDVQQSPPATLTPRDLQLVGVVADQLAVALQKAQLYTDLQNSLRQEKELRAQLIHSEKLAVTGRLIASVSHELNNPLQAIQNALFLLKDEIKIPLQAQQDLAIVLRETDRMAALLNRLRTTYKANAFRAEDFYPVQINGVIEDVHALLATHLRHTKIAFEFDADPALPSVGGVGDQLRQVILNLLMNAVDAMPGGGRLAVSAVHRKKEKEVLITISDTGRGIDPEILPHLFEPFITGKENGTGLGLSICREIVSNHKGRIHAENRPEGGATFRVWLPVAGGEIP
jgi:PAS domain S-box-containing protein